MFQKKLKICPKIEILSKNKNFVQKQKFYPKIEILSKRRKLPKFRPKMEFCRKKTYQRQKKQNILKKMKLVKYKNFPNSEYISTYGLYLPSYLGLKKKDLDRIIIVLNKILTNY